MTSRKEAARRRLLESLDPSLPIEATRTDRDIAAASYRALLNSVAAQSELLDEDAAQREVLAEIAQMRKEKRQRSNIGVSR